MQKIKILMFPSFIGELLESKALHYSDLCDIKKMSTILSELSVIKILSLNDSSSVTAASNSKVDKALSLFNLEIFKSYVTNANFENVTDTNVPIYTVGNTLNALTSVGNEGINPVLEKNLHNFALPFRTARIKPNTYAIIFQPLCEVDSPQVRVDKYLKDMESLLEEVSLELSDNELLVEPIYQHYLSLV